MEKVKLTTNEILFNLAVQQAEEDQRNGPGFQTLLLVELRHIAAALERLDPHIDERRGRVAELHEYTTRYPVIEGSGGVGV